MAACPSLSISGFTSTSVTPTIIFVSQSEISSRFVFTLSDPPLSGLPCPPFSDASWPPDRAAAVDEAACASVAADEVVCGAWVVVGVCGVGVVVGVCGAGVVVGVCGVGVVVGVCGAGVVVGVCGVGVVVGVCGAGVVVEVVVACGAVVVVVLVAGVVDSGPDRGTPNRNPRPAPIAAQ